MSESVITILLLIVAIIHLVPLIGVLGVAKLEALYGIPLPSNELAILMRHRAVLFGILGVFFVYAAIRKIVIGDVVAALALAGAVILYYTK
jgi:hypothetical protein